MKPVLIVYATREGQTRHVAEHIDEYLQRRGFQTSLCDLSTLPQQTPLYASDYAAVVVAASIHDRKHAAEAAAFVKRHAEELNDLPCLVLSVSFAQIVAESERAPRWLRALAAAGARKLLRRFLADAWLLTGHAYPVAGALAYTKYTRAQRRAFVACAWLAGLSTDATRDHVFTDVKALDAHVDALTVAIARHVPRAARCA